MKTGGRRDLMDNGKGAKHCSVVEAINDRFTLNEGDIACHQYSAYKGMISIASIGSPMIPA